MSSRQVGVPAVPGQGPPVWEIPPSIAAFPWQEHREEQNHEFLLTLILISRKNFSEFPLLILISQRMGIRRFKITEWS